MVVGDDASDIEHATIAAVSCGRTDLMHSLSTEDLSNYTLPILPPVQQWLARETAVYLRHHSLPFSEGPSLCERAFSHERKHA
jgi:hypothetical protein